MIYPCNIKIPKNKSSPNALKMNYNFFLEYLRIYGTKNTPGALMSWPQGWRARPLTLWAPRGPLHLFQHPSTPSYSRKNHPVAQTRVLFHLAAIFDLLVQSSICKTNWGIILRYVTPPMVQLVFVLVLIANFCCCADLVLEL